MPVKKYLGISMAEGVLPILFNTTYCFCVLGHAHFIFIPNPHCKTISLNIHGPNTLPIQPLTEQYSNLKLRIKHTANLLQFWNHNKLVICQQFIECNYYPREVIWNKIEHFHDIEHSTWRKVMADRLQHKWIRKLLQLCEQKQYNIWWKTSNWEVIIIKQHYKLNNTYTVGEQPEVKRGGK